MKMSKTGFRKPIDSGRRREDLDLGVCWEGKRQLDHGEFIRVHTATIARITPHKPAVRLESPGLISSRELSNRGLEQTPCYATSA